MPENNAPAGHPMNEIARQFKTPAEPFQGVPTASKTALRTTSVPGGHPRTDSEPPQEAWQDGAPFSFTPAQIETPAFFVDRHLTVRWIAPGGADNFSRALDAELRSVKDKNIFNLLLQPTVKEALDGWDALFSFVYVLLRRATPREVFDSETVFIAQNQHPRMAGQDSPDADARPFTLESCPLGKERLTGQAALRIFGLSFNQGTLFLLRRDRWTPADVDTAVDARPVEANLERRDLETSVCLLSVRLNDSQRIADTMLPEVFFRLMNFVWEEVDTIATALGGRRLGSSGAHNHYVFKASAGRNPIFSTICCATRINERMLSLEKRITDDLGWVDDVCMNMGISHGQADPGPSDPDGGMTLKIPGGAFDQASLLSAVAGKGDIWITKNAIARLPRQLIDQVIMGVERKGQFRRNFFTRISDMPSKNLPDHPKPDLGALSIARILGIEER